MLVNSYKTTTQRVFSVLLLVLIASCGARGGGAGDANDGSNTTAGNANAGAPARVYPATPLSCELPEMRRWVHANMLDYYLFYDQTVTPQLDQFNTVEELVRDMRVQPYDRFSYISNAEQSNAQFNQGIYFGFGPSLVVETQADNSRRLRISYVDPGSPFAQAAVQRGDYLAEINGKSPFDLSRTEVENLYGLGGNSVTMDFTVQSGDGLSRNFSLNSTSYQAQTVTNSRVLDINGIQSGYLTFNAFLETSRNELDTAFSNFKSANITELILDLRYNRGGRVSVANKLASMIVGDAGANRNFLTVAMNDKYASENQSILFQQEPNSLGLSRIVVLTSRSSCSASELVINSLRPFMDVVVIGQQTCGKPYGSLGRTACGKQMNALEFEFVNDQNSGGYYDGIATDCAASDDLDHALGDTQEGMLAGAIDYIKFAGCQTVLASRTKASTSQTQAWLFQQPGLSDLTGSLP